MYSQTTYRKPQQPRIAHTSRPQSVIRNSQKGINPQQEQFRQKIKQQFNLNIVPSRHINYEECYKGLSRVVPRRWNDIKSDLPHRNQSLYTKKQLNIALQTAMLKKEPLAGKALIANGAELCKRNGQPLTRSDYHYMYKRIKSAQAGHPNLSGQLTHSTDDEEIKRVVLTTMLEAATGMLSDVFQEIVQILKDALQEISYRVGLNVFSQDLRNLALDEANLDGVEFSNTNLENSSFKGASLISATFNHSNLKNANFEDANLENASIHNCDTSGIRLNHANLRGASFRKDMLAPLPTSNTYS